MNYLSLSIPGPDGQVSIQGAGGVPMGGQSTLVSIIGVGVSILIIASIILSLLFLIWGGLSWITSEGDKQRLAQARQRVVFSILGLIVVFLAYLIINTVYAFFLGS